MKERILSSIMAIVMVIGISTSLLSVSVSAGGSSFSSAQYIYTDYTYSDSTPSTSAYNYYEFYLSSPGYINVNFYSELFNSSGVYWYVELYDSNYYEMSSWKIYGNYEEQACDYVGLPAGTYYVRIHSNRSSAIDYSFNVSYRASNYWEKEFNDGYTSATPISLNTKYYGTTLTTSDHDYYKFQMDKSGYINVNFYNEMFNSSGVYWYVELYDSNYYEMCTWKIYGNYEKQTCDYVGLPAGTYYVKVYSNRTSAIDYSFNVGYKATNYWEKEINNSYTSATPINLNTKYYGTSVSTGDYDYYKFSIKTNGNHEVKFNYPKGNSSSTYWRIYIYDSAYNVVSDYYVKGNTSSLSAKLNLKKGTYYIRINASTGAACGLIYNLSINTYIPRVSGFKFAGASENAIKLTWNKVSGATGYVVYRYNTSKKSWTRLGVVTANTYTDKKLKSGSTYKYAVRAYKKVDGKTIYSVSYPTVNACTDPATVNFKLTAGSKKATVSWSKVSGASGYIVYYKTSKNGSWQKLKTTTSLKYTKTGLKKGKTYYFTVRAYKALGGKAYAGKFVTKAVKVK